jgi:hypothetical protein
MALAPDHPSMSEQDDPPADARVDVVLYPDGEVWAVPAGKGGDVVRSFRERDGGISTEGHVLAILAVVAVLAYSLLITRTLLLGVLAAAVVYGVARLVPVLSGSDAELLDADVALRDARQQWDADPVAEVGGSRGGGGERVREHAFE